MCGSEAHRGSSYLWLLSLKAEAVGGKIRKGQFESLQKFDIAVIYTDALGVTKSKPIAGCRFRVDVKTFDKPFYRLDTHVENISMTWFK